MGQADVKLRLEGHLYVKNFSGRRINVLVVGDGDEVSVDFPPGHDTVINYTIYNGGDLFPRDDYIFDVILTNKDTGKKFDLKGLRAHAASAYSGVLTVADGIPDPNELEVVYVEGLPSLIQSANTKFRRA
ncbi:hypothetical protein H3V53_13975 [Paraburkholderia bengalensis]|uniref:Uncharacterized protein n=1 Tax=Paraburkholderia bengalensis TaxID=2747562 RepID=A0ABU8IS58_9BURK